MEIAIMIEGQMGLNWPRWQRLVRAVEDFGFVGLYRSDHFVNPAPPDMDSLELWASFVWLAANTERIEFGSLVSPVSFRHPAMTARMAAAVDDLSHGRLTLGLGAGWNEREHTAYSYDLLSLPERFARFEEGIEIIARLLGSDEPVTFEGEYYHFQDAVLLPRPVRPGGPPILIGGNGIKRTLPLAAQYGREWNGVYLTPAGFAERSARLDDLLRENRREPGDVRRSLMVGIDFALDEKSLLRKIDPNTPDDLRSMGKIVGTPSEVRDQLDAFAAVGVQRVMLQWLDLDDIDGLEALANAVL